MPTDRRLRVLLIVPLCDSRTTGEGWSGYQFARCICERVDATVVVLAYRDGRDLAGIEGLKATNVLRVQVARLGALPARFRYMAKPAYIEFFFRARGLVRRLLRSAGCDIVHQFTPLALRYPSPATGLGYPTVIGPVGGSVPSPPAFRRELGSMAWYTHLRRLDSCRLRWDPWLRRTFREASLVLGVAPYVQNLLKAVPLRRFEIMNETGVLSVPQSSVARTRIGSALRLLYVGRVIRSKGVRDAIRAMAHLSDLATVSLDIVGDGNDLAVCRREAHLCGLDGRVRFHGARPRTEVNAFYEKADVFLFPSFREPSGNVVLEALSFGLPAIVADAGGPAFTVRASVGIRVPVSTPEEYPRQLAAAIREFAMNPAQVDCMGRAARELVQKEYLWDAKADRMVRMYESVIRGGCVVADGGN